MRLILLTALSLLVSSCNNLSSTVRNFSPPKLKNIISGQRDIQVVQVRPDSLKEITDPQKKALAYFENRRARQNAAAALNLKPIDLPAAGSDFQGLPTNGILPPLKPGTSTEFAAEVPPINFEGE